MKLSVIIPAYNAERHIVRCLDSILAQQFNNDIEIIIVNDGSVDSTAKILEEYSNRYPKQIIIINQGNMGLVTARNVGLSAASGDWVWFCDADDYVIDNGLSYVIDRFVDETIDVCSFFSLTLDSKALKSYKEFPCSSGDIIFEGTTIEKFNQHFSQFVWNHLYRLNAIRGIRFRNVIMCEDVVFNLDVYMRNLRIRSTNANIYRYTTHDNQVTRKRDRETLIKSIRSYEFLFSLAKEYESSCNSIRVGNNRLFAYHLRHL